MQVPPGIALRCLMVVKKSHSFNGLTTWGPASEKPLTERVDVVHRAR